MRTFTPKPASAIGHATPALLAALALLLLLHVPVRAQESVDDSHQAAAAELVDLLKLEENTAASVDVMMETMIAQNPQFEELRDVFEEFFDEYFRWENLRPEYVRLYAEAYTEAEIRELIAFYRTPVGRKSVDLMPMLMQRGAEIGQRQIQPHLGELQRRIMERVGGG